MARVKATNKKVKVNKDMESLVINYSIKKPEFDKLKKEVDSLGTEIKTKMIELGMETYQGSNNFEIKVTDVVSESFDDERLLEWAKRKKLPITKQVTIIDPEALENAVYNGLISPADLAQFQITKVTKRMTSKFIKE